METKNRYIIAYKGLSAGTHEFKFVVDASLFREFESPEISDGNLNVDVKIIRNGSIFELEVEIDGTVVVPCDRCLENVTLPVYCDNQLYVKFSETETESDGDIMWISPGDDVIDLKQYIYESISLALPFQRIHPTDENGVSGCNPEMLSKFSIIDPEQFDRMYPNVNLDGEDTDDEDAEDEEYTGETIGLSMENIKKLEDIKNKLK